MEPEIPVTPGSGNVFADLGLERPELELAKSLLVERIAEQIHRRGLTQREAARLLGIGQPKVSALVRGHWSGYSMDRLIRFLNALDQDVRIVVEDRKPTEERATLTVEAA